MISKPQQYLDCKNYGGNKYMLQKLLSSTTFFVAILASNASSASILSFGPGTDSIGSVTISQTAEANVSGRNSKLVHVSSGMRTKKIATAHIDIYVAQLFANDRSKVTCTEVSTPTTPDTLDSLDGEATVALSMSFVRNVDAATVLTSFKDSLAANGIAASDTDVAKFLNLVANAGPAFSDSSFIVIGEKLSDGTEVISFENSDGKAESVVGAKDFIKKVFSIWLGKPAAGDADLATLIHTLATCSTK
jgi:hypothetical protein